MLIQLLVSLAMVPAQPQTCAAVYSTETRIVDCKCGVTAKDLKRVVCESSLAEGAIDLKEVKQ